MRRRCARPSSRRRSRAAARCWCASAAAACATPICHLHDGYFSLGGDKKLDVTRRTAPLPFTLGHEIAGVVEKVGPDADVKPGTPAAVSRRRKKRRRPGSAEARRRAAGRPGSRPGHRRANSSRTPRSTTRRRPPSRKSRRCLPISTRARVPPANSLRTTPSTSAWRN